MRKQDCLFCRKIVEGEIPSTKVYEDEHVFAVRGREPDDAGPYLIVPKNHFDNIADNVPEEELSVICSVLSKRSPR